MQFQLQTGVRNQNLMRQKMISLGSINGYDLLQQARIEDYL